MNQTAASDAQGRIYVIGGQTQDGTYTTAVDRFDPQAGTWTTVANLPAGRYQAAAALGADGLIYVMGGCTTTACPTSSVIAYDPATDTWLNEPHMLTARFGLAAVAAPDGRIYAIGGQGPDPNAWSEVEAFDPIGARTWAVAAPLVQPASSATAAIGPGGSLYECGNGSDLEVYGPAISLSETSGQPGDTVTVSGQNFAPDAVVDVYWGTVATGTVVAEDTTDPLATSRKLLVHRAA